MHIMIQCDYAPFMQVYLFSYEKWQGQNWSQEIHVITPYIDFECIKGKENILDDSLSRSQTLVLYEANESQKEGHEYGISIFDSETVCNIKKQPKG